MKPALWIAAAALAAAAAGAFLAAPRGAAQEEKPAYVGDKACQKCHFQQHKAWRKTKLATSVATLRPTAEADDKRLFDRKVEAKLDPAKDYSGDAQCLKCHTTGFAAGGFPADPKASPADEKLAETFGKVGCEACHGAGSLYVRHKTAALEKDKDAKFTFDEMAKHGLVKPDEALCRTCHNPESPTKEVFDFAERKTKVHDTTKK